MRLTDAKVQSLTDQLVTTITEHPQVTLRGTPSQIAFQIKSVILEDLRREDDLDEEDDTDVDDNDDEDNSDEDEEEAADGEPSPEPGRNEGQQAAVTGEEE